MSKKNSWEWWNKDDDDYGFEKSYETYKPSTWKYNPSYGASSWMSQFNGGWNSYSYYGASDNKAKYEKVLKQLQNSASVLGKNTKIKIEVRWAGDKTKNTYTNKKHTIFVSPDGLIESGTINNKTLDSLTGYVYAGSALRETVSANCRNQADIFSIALKRVHDDSGCPCGKKEYYVRCCKRGVNNIKNTKTINHVLSFWQSFETSVAKNKIFEEWTGFFTCLNLYLTENAPGRIEMEKLIADNPEPSFDVVCSWLNWNILFEDDLELPVSYSKYVDIYNKHMSNPIKAKDRFVYSERIINEIYDLFQSENKEGLNKKNAPDFNLDQLMGQKVVENNVDATLNNLRGDSKDCSDAIEDNGVSDLGKNFVLIKMPKAKSSEYTKYRKKLSPYISAIQSAFQFRKNDVSSFSFGHLRGDIDENNLFKMKMKDPRLMQLKDQIDIKKMAVCLLIDESGSMMQYNKIEDAQKVAVILAEALSSIKGISINIFGHSAEEAAYKDKLTLREYYTASNRDISSCLGLKARSENHDGYAIQHTARIFCNNHLDYDEKYMFVISDGAPAGSGYGGPPAAKHINNVCAFYRKRGLNIYGIGVSNAFSKASGKEMYGDKMFTVLPDVTSSIGVLKRFLVEKFSK